MTSVGHQEEPKLLRALKGEVSAIPPLWFMRQAGRYLPEYRALRTRAGSFLDLCFDSRLAAEVTLQPVDRFDVDAAILFADILLIPYALGQNLRFEEGEGPRLDPVVTPETLSSFRREDVLEKLAPVFETVRLVRKSLSPSKALIGFAGAPWTVATYMLAGGPMKDPSALRELFYRQPAFVGALIDLLCETTVDYLVAQIDAGADAVQLFDTWAGGLPWPVLDAVSLVPLDRIAGAVKKARPGIPVIVFPKGVGEKAREYALAPSFDAIGIDHGMDPAWARAELSPRKTVQGGPDPLLMIEGGPALEKAAGSYLRLFHDAPFVFNLGHGLTPTASPDHVAALVEFVRGGSWRS